MTSVIGLACLLPLSGPSPLPSGKRRRRSRERNVWAALIKATLRLQGWCTSRQILHVQELCSLRRVGKRRGFRRSGELQQEEEEGEAALKAALPTARWPLGSSGSSVCRAVFQDRLEAAARPSLRWQFPASRASPEGLAGVAWKGSPWVTCKEAAFPTWISCSVLLLLSARREQQQQQQEILMGVRAGAARQLPGGPQGVVCRLPGKEPPGPMSWLPSCLCSRMQPSLRLCSAAAAAPSLPAGWAAGSQPGSPPRSHLPHWCRDELHLWKQLPAPLTGRPERHPRAWPGLSKIQTEVLGQEGLCGGGSAWAPGALALAAPPALLGLPATLPGLPGGRPRPLQPGNAPPSF